MLEWCLWGTRWAAKVAATNSDGGMYWVNISCMKWIIYATKRIFHDIFPRSYKKERERQRHRPRKWNFLTLHASTGMNIEIVCVELWNSQIEHSNGKFSSSPDRKLASSCCSLSQCSELVAKFIYQNCYDTFGCVSRTLKETTYS
jgi:hypothetical protein